MEKLEEGGKIAVLYSPGLGAGWSTWNSDNRLIFDPRLVQAVLDGDLNRAVEVAEEISPELCTCGGEDLEVEWIEKGVQFQIDEYDGSESIHILGEDSYFTA